jgi:hypothetical protein
MSARRSGPAPPVEGAVRYPAPGPGTERRLNPHSRPLSGVQVDSSVALLVRILIGAVELLFSTSVPVSTGGYWSTFDGPETAQRRPGMIFKLWPPC